MAQNPTARTPLPPDVGRRWLEKHPQVGDGPIPVDSLVSPEWFERERDFVFKKCWLHVATLDEISKPGDYVVRNIHAAKASILIVRSDDGEVRAFQNVCRHRGNKLVPDFKGHRAGCAWSCRFHGFTYDSRGQLTFVPEEKNFYQPLQGQLNLPPVAVAVWQGFIFIHLDPEPEESLEAFLGPLTGHLGDYPFSSIPQRFHYQSYLRANWKIVLDSQSEVFHVRYLHSQTWPKLFNRPDRPFIESLDIKLYDRHSYGNFPGNPEYSPKDIELFALGKYGSITRLVDNDNPPGPGINSSRAPDWGFDIIHLFPNTNVLVTPNVWHVHQFWPISENQTLWELKIHMPEPQNVGERFSNEYGRILLRDALREDGTINETNQEALESGAIDEIFLQDEEILLRHSYWALAQQIRRGREALGQ